jgi:hypothetical protein
MGNEHSGYYSDDSYGGYYSDPYGGGTRNLYTDGWGHPRYENMNEISEATWRRVQEAIAKFDKARQDFLLTPEPKVSGSSHTIQLLQPKCHLMGKTYPIFRKHVLKFAGWKVKHRVATAEEKLAAKEMRKGKVYFIDVIYTVPKAMKEMTAMNQVTITAPPGPSIASITATPKNSDPPASTTTTAIVTAEKRVAPMPASGEEPVSKKAKLGDPTANVICVE